MDIFFRTDKSLIKMKDKIEVEGKNYLTTSSLNGQEKIILGQYETYEKAISILNKIDDILDKAIEKDANSVSININSK
jgi:hypothetical protein